MLTLDDIAEMIDCGIGAEEISHLFTDNLTMEQMTLMIESLSIAIQQKHAENKYL